LGNGEEREVEVDLSERGCGDGGVGAEWRKAESVVELGLHE
jgi:hypothetical protein